MYSGINGLLYFCLYWKCVWVSDGSCKISLVVQVFLFFFLLQGTVGRGILGQYFSVVVVGLFSFCHIWYKIQGWHKLQQKLQYFSNKHSAQRITFIQPFWQKIRLINPTHRVGSRDSLLVRAPDSWSKGCEFESRQERRENFLLQS